MIPTNVQADAARAWLDRWVPGWTLGQWAALCVLLAEQADRAKRTRAA